MQEAATDSEQLVSGCTRALWLRNLQQEGHTSAATADARRPRDAVRARLTSWLGSERERAVGMSVLGTRQILYVITCRTADLTQSPAREVWLAGRLA